jgi:hypothetical protein
MGTFPLDGHDVMFQILVKLECKQVDVRRDPDLVQLCSTLPEVTAEQVRRIMESRPTRIQ